MTPNRTENEKELDENAAKRQNTAHDDAGNWFSVEDLVGNGPWDCIGANWMLNWPLLVPVKGTQKGQWYFQKVKTALDTGCIVKFEPLPEIPNHKSKTTTSDVKGMAAEEPSPHKIRFMMKKMPN